MSTKLNKESGNAIIVDGVVLTERAIGRLKSWQDNNNEMLRSAKEDIADAFCIIGQVFDLETGKADERRARASLIALSYIREYFDDLMKP